jgi:hypothetical protein
MCARRQAVRWSALAGVLFLLLSSASARAQAVPLAQLLPRLILAEIILDSPPFPAGDPIVPAGFSHQAHFSPLEANDLNNPVVGIVQSFNTQMATQFSTFPLGSSTGGLTYVFDESVGTFRRGSRSFGPSFSERALTIGRRKLSIGFNYQRTSYDTFEGQHLDDGSMKFYLRHEDCCTLSGGILTGQPNGTRLNPPFEGDVIEAALSLKATTHTTAGFANYGLTDHWDVGLAVPFVRVNLDAQVEARILRLVTGAPTLSALPAEVRRAALDVHTFDPNNPDATRIVRESGEAAGIGDVVLRTKYHFLRTAGGGLAAAADVRLPTGNEEDLLGAGGAQAKLLLVASTERGRFAQHANVGYTAAEGTVAGGVAGLASASLPDEINFSGGIEFVASPRVTVMGDLIGRTLRGAGRLDVVGKMFQYRQFDPQTAAVLPASIPASISLDEFAPRTGDLTLLLGTGGVKFNPTGNLLISGSVLFPLTDAGLRSRLTTVVGVDYAF